MIRHLKVIIVWSIIFGAGLATSCLYFTNEMPPKTSNASQALTPTPEPEKIFVLSVDETAAVKKFAESYQPRSGREVIPSPPVPDEQISQILAKAANANSREHEKFVVLIFVRLSRFQLENFKQRYELGQSNPLTKEFYRLVGWNESKEFNPAYLADNYVEKNPELRQYGLIEAEMLRIAKAGQRIKNDSYQ